MSILSAPGARLVIGHRGAAAHAPENTIPSFRLALAQGADALELDVRASGDGVPVVIHDPDTGRIAGERLVVARATAARLEALGAGIPTLDEVLESLPDATLLLEVKAPAVQAAVLAAVRAHAAAGRVAVGSVHHAALAAFRGTEVAVSGSRREIGALWLRAGLGLGPGRLRCAMFSVPERWLGLRVVTPGFVRGAHAAGATVHAWTVDDPARAAALWAAGVEGIVTNDPAALVQARRGLAA